ncbi:MAG: XrtA/PEP-CTERM system TPR-repeat protein PrsT [Kordiimonas sp.]
MYKTYSNFISVTKALCLTTCVLGGVYGVNAQAPELEAARSAIADENYSEAIEQLNDLRLEGAAAVEQYTLLADALLQTGAGISAEAAIERARRLGADYAQTVVPYAKALLIQGKYSAALTALQGATIPTSMQLNAFIVSGDANFAEGFLDSAARDYTSARELDDTDFQAYLGLARLELRNGNLDGAKLLTEQALERAASNTMVHYTLGLISRYLGDADKAEQHFVEAVRLYGANIMANIELASIRINQGRLEEAERHLDTVYARSPNQRMALYLSGVILATKGQFEEAATLLNRARPVTDQYLPAVYVRGMVAYQMGNHPVAREALEKVLATRPANIVARLALASTYTQQDQPISGLRLLAPLLEAEEVDVNTLMIAATAAVKSGDAEKAEQYYNQAAELKKQGASGGLAGLDTRLALAQYAIGDTEKALATLNTVTAGTAVEIRELGLMGSMQIRTKDYEGAASTITKIIDLNPARALGYNMRGTLQFKLGEYRAAVGSYTEALDRSPQYYAAHRNRGLAYMRLEEYDRAEADLKRLLEAQPDDVLAKAALGKALLSQGEAEEAVDYFREAVRSIPNSAQLSADYSQALADSGNTARAIEQARFTARLASGKPNILKRMGLLLLDMDQARAAERPLSRHVAFKPDSGEAHMLQGRALLRIGLYTGAGISFSRAQMAQSDKADPDVLQWYFFASETLGQKYAEALRRMNNLVFSKRPDDVTPSIVGDLFLASGEPIKAERAYRDALAANQTSKVVIGLSQALVQQGRDEDATAELTRYVAAVPDDRQALEVLGRRLEGLGRFEEAADQYEAILRIGVADAKVAARLAGVYLKLGNSTSIRLAERALLIMPDDPYVLDVHGWVMLQAGRDTMKATKSLSKAVRRSPSNPEYKYHLAMAHLAQGKKSEARRVLRQALNLSQDFEGADEARRQMNLLQY